MEEVSKLLDSVMENLNNLVEMMSHLEKKEDGSLYSLMKGNLQADTEKLEKAKALLDR